DESPTSTAAAAICMRYGHYLRYFSTCCLYTRRQHCTCNTLHGAVSFSTCLCVPLAASVCASCSSTAAVNPKLLTSYTYLQRSGAFLIGVKDSSSDTSTIYSSEYR
ncbi:unnamed protein product, partial [Laminaria digitata]